MTVTEAFQILEVSPAATPEEIQRAYREMVRVWHPDRFPNDPELQRKAQNKLKEINEAYEQLKLVADTSGQLGEDQSKVSFPYRDDEVWYLGHDPRLTPIQSDRQKSTPHGIPAIVTLTQKGLEVVTLSGGQPERLTHYPTSTFVSLRERNVNWATSSKTGLSESEFYPLPNGEMTLRFVDPEQIIRDGITLRLRFRNEYYTQLFVKRICSALNFVPLKSTTKSNGLDALAVACFLCILVMTICSIVLQATR